MGEIYYNAEATIIWISRDELQKVLQFVQDEGSMYAEHGMADTAWNSRIWTLQEAALAKLVLVPDECVVWRFNKYSKAVTNSSSAMHHLQYQLTVKSTPWNLIAPLIIGRKATLEEDYVNGLMGLLDENSIYAISNCKIPYSVILGTAKRSSEPFK
jgi:hypothetical protein